MSSLENQPSENQMSNESQSYFLEVITKENHHHFYRMSQVEQLTAEGDSVSLIANGKGYTVDNVANIDAIVKEVQSVGKCQVD